MCGIVAYIGSKDPLPIILEGLKRLEYRGYDSAGIFISNSKENEITKTAGKVSKLKKALQNRPDINPTLGMGHTRWATHGEPNNTNAHPHQSNSRELTLIHNGIIENYDVLKKELIKRGYKFYSDTDSEVLVNLIEDIQKKEDVKLGKALSIALNQVVGAYGVVVFDSKKPNEIIAARLGSPLAIGIGVNEFFVGSDATPFLEFTRKVVYLEDYEIAVLKKEKPIKIFNITNNQVVDPYIDHLKWNLENIQKGGYKHFMLKEINEQPEAINNALRGRLLANEGKIQVGSLNEHQTKFSKARRIIIVACGTSWHAGLVGEYLLEAIARIPVEVEYASEFRYREPIIYSDDIVIPISQSGETADTLAAIDLAKSKGATVIGVCNVVGSTISRSTHAGSYTHAGPEIGVASTKAFTAQITVLTLMALYVAQKKGSMPTSRFRALLAELSQVPKLVERCFTEDEKIKKIAERFKDSRNFLYLGRGYSFPVALEGALKLKEISYIHAEGYPAAEMKHGPIALIDEEMPVVVVANRGPSYEKVVSNIQEVKARKGIVIAIVSKGDVDVKAMADYTIEIPEIDESLIPFLSVIPLQLLSYHIAVLRGCHVDQPRNLAKSVTVE